VTVTAAAERYESMRRILADRWRDAGQRPGLVFTLVVFVVFLGIAVSVDFPRVALGFKGDEATYYSMTYSFVRDFDATFERHDLVRIWEEYPGPEGIFLKRGTDIDVRRMESFPFVSVVELDDPVPNRLYYGKSYIYPLFAAPFVGIFGTNGFLVFHALLLAMCAAAGYAVLAARGTSPWLAAAFAAAFLFATVVPVYFVWLTPELFNFATVFIGYFLWSYKLVLAERPDATVVTGRFGRFLRSGASDYLAAVLIGVATFSKPTHLILILPMLGWTLLQRRYRSFVALGVTFAVVVAGLFSVNAMITGQFNYQGGQRKSFYSSTGFPFANPRETFDARGVGTATDAVPSDILFHRDTLTVLLWNTWFFTVGRYSGLLPYLFPSIVALVLFFRRRADRRTWQWLIVGALLAGSVGLLFYVPYTYSGGGGPVGNRYFLSYYPLFLFLVPPLRGALPVIVSITIGALFTAKLVFNPFYSSFNPGEHAKAGPLRMLPIERTQLNDLPVAANPNRSRRPLGGTPPVTAYFVDDNAYPPEGDFFWVRGGSRADVLLRSPLAFRRDPAGDHYVSLRVRTFTIEITNGAEPNHVRVSMGWGGESFDMAPEEVRTIELRPGAGVPYKPLYTPASYVYSLSISTTTGFVPFLADPAQSDSRYLGARIRVMPVYYNP
jgi:hypothetical protein